MSEAQLFAELWKATAGNFSLMVLLAIVYVMRKQLIGLMEALTNRMIKRVSVEDKSVDLALHNFFEFVNAGRLRIIKQTNLSTPKKTLIVQTFLTIKFEVLCKSMTSFIAREDLDTITREQVIAAFFTEFENSIETYFNSVKVRFAELGVSPSDMPYLISVLSKWNKHQISIIERNVKLICYSSHYLNNRQTIAVVLWAYKIGLEHSIAEGVQLFESLNGKIEKLKIEPNE